MVMTDDEYQKTQDRLVIVAHSMLTLDLKGFLQRIERADSVGPILNPTLYRLGSGKLERVKRLAQAAKVFQDEVWRQLEELGEEAFGG